MHLSRLVYFLALAQAMSVTTEGASCATHIESKKGMEVDYPNVTLSFTVNTTCASDTGQPPKLTGLQVTQKVPGKVWKIRICSVEYEGVGGACSATGRCSCHQHGRTHTFTVTGPVDSSLGAQRLSWTVAAHTASELQTKSFDASIIPPVSVAPDERAGNTTTERVTTTAFSTDAAVSSTKGEVNTEARGSANRNDGEDTEFLTVAGVGFITTICAFLAAVAIVFFLLVCLCRRLEKPPGAGPHNVELQEVGGRDDDDQNVYSEILDDPPPAPCLPGELRQRTDQTLPAVPSPAPRPINIANSLSGQRRAGIAPPPTSPNQSAGVESWAGARCITPTATGGTEISSNDRSDASDDLIHVPVTPATFEKKSNMSAYVDMSLSATLPYLKKTSLNDQSDMSTYLTPIASALPKKTSSNDQSDMSTYLTPIASSLPKKTSPNDQSDMSTHLTPVAQPFLKKTSPKDLSDMSTFFTPSLL